MSISIARYFIEGCIIQKSTRMRMHVTKPSKQSCLHLQVLSSSFMNHITAITCWYLLDAIAASVIKHITQTQQFLVSHPFVTYPCQHLAVNTIYILVFSAVFILYLNLKSCCTDYHCVSCVIISPHTTNWTYDCVVNKGPIIQHEDIGMHEGFNWELM